MDKTNWERFARNICYNSPKLAEYIRNLLEIIQKFDFQAVEIDFELVTAEQIFNFLEEVAVEQYNNINTTNNKEVIIKSVIKLNLNKFINYYNNNKYIEQITEIQINYCTAAIYTIKYKIFTNLFIAITDPHQKETIIYQIKTEQQ